MTNEIPQKGIYPVDSGSYYGEVLYGYTDIEEAKKHYKEITGEELDVENCSFLNVEMIEEADELKFSWENQEKGIPSIICIQ